MVDAIRVCLAQTGPAHVSIWTWRIGEYDADVLDAIRRRGGLLSATLVVDRAAVAESRLGGDSNARQVGIWVENFGPNSVRFVNNHAKMARIWNDDWRLLLRGSMNLNWNRRFEQMDISDGGPAFDLVTAIEEELPILSLPLNWHEVASATGLTNAWTGEQLQLFDGATPWMK